MIPSPEGGFPFKENPTHILRKQVRLAISVLIQPDIPALIPQRPPAAQVRVLAAHGVARGHADLGLAVVAAVDVHVQHVLLGRRVVDDLGPLHDAAGAQVARAGLREERADVRPLHQVRGRVAVDVLECAAGRLVLADQVEGRADLDDSGAVGLDMLPGVCLDVLMLVRLGR